MREKDLENQSKNSKEFLLPHRPLVRQNSEWTKLELVYDALAESEYGYSLYDFLEKETSLQNKFGDTLIRTRFRPLILCADI